MNLIKKRISLSVGKEVLIFLQNNWRYNGILTNFDDKFVEILDHKTNAFKFLLIKEIKDLSVKN